MLGSAAASGDRGVLLDLRIKTALPDRGGTSPWNLTSSSLISTGGKGRDRLQSRIPRPPAAFFRPFAIYIYPITI